MSREAIRGNRMKLLSASLSDRMLSQHNPLRALSMSRVVSEFENGQRGDYSNLQWLYFFIEKRDATIRGAKRRILSSLLKLDWNIKVRDKLPDGMAEKAEKQQAGLKESYRGLKSFRGSLRHLALSEFRGFSHLEKHFEDDGSVSKLEPVPQWHWCRNGFYGDWLFQENALNGGVSGVPITPENFVIREVEDPINEIALVSAVRKGLSAKDFDAFIARYGIPFVYWVLSEAMAAAVANDPKELSKLMAVMRGIGSDGEGIFPGGEVKTLDASAGGKDNNPFLQHLRYQDEQIVMAATSGKLTMLNDATGLGSGNSDAHQDTFDDIALALAMEISETLHDQFDLPELERLFPGEEPLVYFELAAKDSEDVGKLVDNVKKLEEAGWEIDGAELSEKTGYKLSKKAESNNTPDQAIPNNETGGDDPSAPKDKREPKAPAGKGPAGAAKGAKQKNRAVSAPPEEDEAIRKAAAGFLKGDGSALAGLFASAVLTDQDPS